MNHTAFLDSSCILCTRSSNLFLLLSLCPASIPLHMLFPLIRMSIHVGNSYSFFRTQAKLFLHQAEAISLSSLLSLPCGYTFIRALRSH